MAGYQYGGRNTQTFQKLHGYKKLVAWQAASDLGFLVNQFPPFLQFLQFQ